MYESYDLCEVTVRANLVSKVKLMLETRDPITTFTEFEALVEEVFEEISNFSKFTPKVGEDQDMEIAPEGGENEQAMEDSVEEIESESEEIDDKVEERVEKGDEVEEIEEIEDEIEEIEDEVEEIQEMFLEEPRMWREHEEDVAEEMEVWGRVGGLEEEDEYLPPSPEPVPMVPGLPQGPTISTAWKLPPGGRFVDVQPRDRDSMDMVDGENDEELDFRNGETISRRLNYLQTCPPQTLSSRASSSWPRSPPRGSGTGSLRWPCGDTGCRTSSRLDT